MNKDHQAYIDGLDVEDTPNLLSTCMNNMQDDEVVEAIMKKAKDEDMFMDELESAIQNYAAGLEDDNTS